MVQIDFGFARLTAIQGRRHGTAIEAQWSPSGINVVEKVVAAMRPYSLVWSIPGESFAGRVPVENASVTISNIDTFADPLEDGRVGLGAQRLGD